MTFTCLALNETTYSRVRDKLRQDILSGEFKPGVSLWIVDLSNRYGVSQMPIREACKKSKEVEWTWLKRK
jgi:DNA-binding GntR family transcriptional regulator